MKPFDLKEGHANTHYRVFSEPLGAIEGPDVASGTAGSPLMMAGGNVSSDAVAIPQVLRRFVEPDCVDIAAAD